MAEPAATAGSGPATSPQGAPATMALDLRDIHLPAEPSAWPPAPGWWLLALVLLAAAAVGAVTGWRRWRRVRRRRRIIAELDRCDGPGLVAGVAALLKRAALLRYPGADVAALTGEDWLGFLDRTGGAGRFRNGPGRVLAEGPYAPAAADLDEQALRALARDWLRRNL